MYVCSKTGEALISGRKAEKILGSPMTPEQYKSMIRNESTESTTDDTAALSARKMLYTAPDPGSTNAKVWCTTPLQSILVRFR